MKVTYIGHSGFLIHWPECSWLFDYYEGTLPELEEDKPLFVFVSHRHEDHFNPEIFSIKGPREIIYILSADVKRYMKDVSIPKSHYFVKPEETITLQKYGLSIETLRSTDCGTAFLIHYKEKNIYHAGDLNWWVWEGESKQYNNNMTANFKRYVKPLLGLDLFAAFLPLDPRQERWYDKGFLYILENAHVKHAFPMHFWKDFSVIQKFISSPEGQKHKDSIVPLSCQGQSVEIPE